MKVKNLIIGTVTRINQCKGGDLLDLDEREIDISNIAQQTFILTGKNHSSNIEYRASKSSNLAPCEKSQSKSEITIKILSLIFTQ